MTCLLAISGDLRGADLAAESEPPVLDSGKRVDEKRKRLAMTKKAGGEVFTDG